MFVLVLWWILHITVDKIADDGTFVGEKWQNKSEYFTSNKIKKVCGLNVAYISHTDSEIIQFSVRICSI